MLLIIPDFEIVCVGDELNVQCNSSTNGIEVTVSNNDEFIQRFLTSTFSRILDPVVVGGAEFNILLVSSTTSTVTVNIHVDSVTLHLNGTNITCSNSFGRISTTTLKVKNNGNNNNLQNVGVLII